MENQLSERCVVYRSVPGAARITKMDVQRTLSHGYDDLLPIQGSAFLVICPDHEGFRVHISLASLLDLLVRIGGRPRVGTREREGKFPYLFPAPFRAYRRKSGRGPGGNSIPVQVCENY